jgi:hypothetical protein
VPTSWTPGKLGKHGENITKGHPGNVFFYLFGHAIDAIVCVQTISGQISITDALKLR